MTTISADQIGLRDAADVFGVSIDTLRRRIRDNQMDEALLVQGPFGATWVLPRTEMDSIAEREGWSLDPAVNALPAVPIGGSREGVSGEAVHLHAPSGDDSGAGDDVGPTRGILEGEEIPSENAPTRIGGQVPSELQTREGTLIDLREASPIAHGGAPAAVPNREEQREGGTTVAAPLAGISHIVEDEAALVKQIQVAIAGEVRSALSDNVEAELTRVREAITSAEVRAVAAEARTDAMRGEQGRLAAQLKRAEADAEYWRSQHDRLDRELDRERTGRVSAEKARAVAETRSGELTRTGEQLRKDLTTAQERERELARTEAETQAQLDQARMAMGWWSRRRLQRLGQRSESGGGRNDQLDSKTTRR